MAHVLIVDDEADLASLVEFNLQQEGLQTSIAHTGSEALALARARTPDVIILDLMLPDVSGKEVCRRLRAENATRAVPIVMLTARGEEGDRVAGFEVGADDYVTKPFSPRELVLRIRAILRRARVTPTNSVMKVGLLSVDTVSHRAWVGDAELALTALEFKLLLQFVARPGRMQSREQLLADVWGITSPVETRTVDTHVMRLRDKLGPARDAIETVRGAGYRLSDSSALESASASARQ
jgi:two-component system phosphate regulon response regulator PhoB